MVSSVANTPRPTSNPAPTSRAVLSQGARGEDVRDLQDQLRARGHDIAVDGHFGPQTEAAVRAFQRAENLVVDGVAGPNTLGRLNAPASAPDPAPAAPVDVMAPPRPAHEPTPTAPAAPSTPPPNVALSSGLQGADAVSLQRGARGPAVRTLQERLNAHGANLSVDGQFGPATEGAVRAFQTAQGLDVNGVANPQTLARLQAAPTAAPPPAAAPDTPPPVPGTSGTSELPAPSTVQTQGGAVRFRADATREALRAQGPEMAALVDEMQARGFHPVRLSDGRHVFMSNPTYDADTNGGGTSSNEAHAYANARGLRLPTQAEADAFRAQAPVVVQFEAGPTPGTANARSGTAQEQRIAARLAAAGVPGGVAVAGATKIWAQEPGRQPGLNGAVTNVGNGAALQRYSTVHGPDYEDYSQAAQFVHPTWISADGRIHD